MDDEKIVEDDVDWIDLGIEIDYYYMMMMNDNDCHDDYYYYYVYVDVAWTM